MLISNYTENISNIHVQAKKEKSKSERVKKCTESFAHIWHVIIFVYELTVFGCLDSRCTSYDFSAQVEIGSHFKLVSIEQ